MDRSERESTEVVVKDTEVAVKETEAMEGSVENLWVIELKNPIRFEGQTYNKIDLNGLHEIKAADMIAINRRMSRNGNIDQTQEVTLEYALNMANLVTGLPLEFFDQLPPNVAMAVRGRVINFLFRQG